MEDETMSGEGWLKLWRKTLESDVWGMSYLSRCVFFWLLMSVNYETGEIMTNYKKIAVAVSPEASDPPTIKQVRRVIDGLIRADVVSKIGMVDGQRYLHLKVLHWERYQGNGRADHGAAKGQTLVQEGAATIETRRKNSTVPTLCTVPTSTTVEERVALAALNSAPGYKFDFDSALDFVREMMSEFPTVDVAEEIKAWRNWLRDKPLKSNSRPHAQIRNWLKRATPSVSYGQRTADEELDALCKLN